MNTPKTQKRKYKKITPRVVANHAAQAIIDGNNSAAVRTLEPDDNASDGAVRVRAVRIVAKSNNQDAAAFIESALQQIAEPAIQRVNEMVMSSDERIAAKMSTYVIDQIRGKAVQRSISLTGRLNIQNVLD